MRILLILVLPLSACAANQKKDHDWYEDISVDVGLDTQGGLFSSVGVSYPILWDIWANTGWWAGTDYEASYFAQGWYIGLGYSFSPFAKKKEEKNEEDKPDPQQPVGTCSDGVRHQGGSSARTTWRGLRGGRGL